MARNCLKFGRTAMKTLTLFSCVLALMTSVQANASSQDAAQGLWLTENGKAIVRVEPCGSKICGTTVWLANARDTTGKLKVDGDMGMAMKLGAVLG